MYFCIGFKYLLQFNSQVYLISDTGTMEALTTATASTTATTTAATELEEVAMEEAVWVGATA